MKKFLNQSMRTAAKVHHLVSLLHKNADNLLTNELSLSFVQAMILKIISHHPNMSQKELTECTTFTAGGVSRQVELLREKGFLNRKQKKDNRREHTITITTKGKAEMVRAFELLDSYVDNVFTELNQTEVQQLEDTISKLIYKIDPDYYKFEHDIK